MQISSDRRAALSRFLARHAGSIILAVATVIAALITAVGWSRHELAERDREIVDSRARLATTELELDAARVTVDEKSRESAQLRQQLATLRAIGGSPRVQTPPTEDAGSSSPPSAAELPIRVREARGFTIRLGSCERSGGTVVCQFTVTNDENERTIALWAFGHGVASRAIDESGNEHYAERGALGSEVEESPEVSMPSGVPMRAWLRFRNIPAEAKAFRLLQISFTRGDTFKVDFPMVAIAT